MWPARSRRGCWHRDLLRHREHRGHREEQFATDGTPMHTDGKRVVLLICALLLCGCGQKSTELFNGRDLSGWYTYTTATKGENPGIFTAEDGVLKIRGGDGTKAYYGGIYTTQSYENYRLTVEYQFAGPTH